MSTAPADRRGESAVRPEISDATKDFSLVLGGPVYQYLIRVGLVKPPLDQLGWRLIVITLFAWAPVVQRIEIGPTEVAVVLRLPTETSARVLEPIVVILSRV